MATTRPSHGEWEGAHILITSPFPEEEHISSRLESLGLRITWVKAFSEVEDQSVYRDVDILATLLAVPKSREVCPKLKYIHTFTAGIDQILQSSLSRDTSLRFSSSTGIHGSAIAEWIFMSYMAFEKRYEMYCEAQRQRTSWTKHGMDLLFHARDLVGQRIGIVGYGSIGRQIARVAKAFGMEVLAYTATPKTTPEARKNNAFQLLPDGGGDPDGLIPKQWFHGFDKASLHLFLSQGIDLLILACPLTEQTRGLLGKEEFRVLANNSPYGGAFIANVARGEVLVQQDLIEALKSEGSGVRGAALDAFAAEPLPPEDPLWEAPNCYITPHNSSHQNRFLERGMEILIGNLKKPRSSAVINEVDVSRGY